jgi:CRP-like cAMP-binding protein
LSPEELKRFKLFAEFSEDDREALAELLEERRLPDGKSACREGTEGEGLVLLCEGRLKLKSARTGKVVAVLEAPAHLGAASLFSFGKREVTAIAEGPALVRTLPRSGLPRLADDAPRAAFRLAEAIAGELAALVRQGIDALVANDPEDLR